MFFKKIIFSLLLLSFSLSFADKLDDIKRKEIIHVGVKYEHKPMGFINQVGKIDGFEIDLMRFISDKLNVSVKLHQVTASDRIMMLQEDKIDVIVATMHDEVSDSISISKPYFFDSISMLVHIGEKAESISEFSSRIVGTLKGDLSSSLLEKNLKDTRKIEFTEYPQAMRSFKRKNISAILADKVWCEQKAKMSNGKYRVLNFDLKNLNYVMGVKSGEKRLLKELNKAIDESVTEGVYEETYDKWFLKQPTKLPKVSLPFFNVT